MKNSTLIILILFTAISFAQRSPFKNMTERNGQIGIGTSTPDALLTVKGQIHTQEVLVDLNGAVAPDYVFESYYNGVSELNPHYYLPKLAEVENYIKQYHHLEGVPSAAALEKEGMLLKNMNLILLQKIEELTLYTLEQQKEIDSLKEKVSKITD